jgi:hypothetical protein
MFARPHAGFGEAFMDRSGDHVLGAMGESSVQTHMRE